MTDSETRKALYREAFALLARAEALLDAMREKYERQVAEQTRKNAA
jgi:hypothetical protein